MNFLECIIYGLISGLAEFLPISAAAHQTILATLFGADDQPLLTLLVHLGMLGAVFLAARRQMEQIRRERRLRRVPAKRRKRQPEQQSLLDFALVRSASIPVLLGILLSILFGGKGFSMPVMVVFLIINGIILFVPQFLPSGNKDSRSMTRLDGLLMGLFGAFGVLPGVSRVGAMLSVASARGADKQKALNWCLLVSVPALIGLLLADVYTLIFQGAGSLDIGMVLRFFLSAGAACGGGYIAISGMRFLALKQSFSGFAYYSWGAALFLFILYMTI